MNIVQRRQASLKLMHELNVLNKLGYVSTGNMQEVTREFLAGNNEPLVGLINKVGDEAAGLASIMNQ